MIEGFSKVPVSKVTQRPPTGNTAPPAASDVPLSEHVETFSSAVRSYLESQTPPSHRESAADSVDGKPYSLAPEPTVESPSPYYLAPGLTIEPNLYHLGLPGANLLADVTGHEVGHGVLDRPGAYTSDANRGLLHEELGRITGEMAVQQPPIFLADVTGHEVSHGLMDRRTTFHSDENRGLLHEEFGRLTAEMALKDVKLGR